LPRPPGRDVSAGRFDSLRERVRTRPLSIRAVADRRLGDGRETEITGFARIEEGWR